MNNDVKNLGLDIMIKSEDTCENLGKRMMAKICVNSLWGKFGQALQQPEYAFANSYPEFCKIFHDPRHTIQAVNIHDNCTEVQ